MKIDLSPLPHTWLFDIDGTLVVHNGYLNGGDRLLPGVKETFAQIPSGDSIILMTARPQTSSAELERFLEESGIRYDRIIYDVPQGERVLVNDKKPSGLITAYAINKERDAPLHMDISVHPDW